MRILIGCAKDMTDTDIVSPSLRTEPMFREQALHNALQMMSYGEEELRQMLGCNAAIARQNRLRYRHFADDEPSRQAVLAYTGIVYKYIRPEDFSAEDFAWSQEHLRITSFLYGLLRPMDMIKPYRLEGSVVLPDNGVSMFDYWKPLLTDELIRDVKAGGGVLLDLASSEMRRLFNWRRVAREVTVVRPEFRVMKDGRLKTIVIYSKMCRGAMARYVLKNRIDDAGALRGFSFEGFEYSESDSRDGFPFFIMG